MEPCNYWGKGNRFSRVFSQKLPLAVASSSSSFPCLGRAEQTTKQGTNQWTIFFFCSLSLSPSRCFFLFIVGTAVRTQFSLIGEWKIPENCCLLLVCGAPFFFHVRAAAPLSVTQTHRVGDEDFLTEKKTGFLSQRHALRGALLSDRCQNGRTKQTRHPALLSDRCL